MSDINSTNINSLEPYFLTNSPVSHANYRAAVTAAQNVLAEKFATLTQTYSGKAISELQADLNTQLDVDGGKSLPNVIEQVGEEVVQHLINVNHPLCIAHLHCPPLIASIAAEMIIGATNQSMDSWDQSAAATLVEQQVVEWFCTQYGFGEEADGTFTSGGTQSNFMGMLLARDYAAQQHFDWSVTAQGLPPQAHKFRILCSPEGHFSIRQAARLLGLGDQAVVSVPLDEHHRLLPAAVQQSCQILTDQGLLPIALVSTAGTTDFGTISPLGALAACAQELGLWFHVDAAVGGGLMFSESQRHRLAGIEQADSLTVDFHKLFYQSISCGIFLLKNRAHFDLMQLNADYLNPESNADFGLLDLVGKSIQTTRRFDALKIYITLQAYGRKVFGQIIDRTIALAQQTAQLIDRTEDLALATPPTLNTVVFRYEPATTLVGQEADSWTDAMNEQIRLTLLQSGQAVIGFTKFNGLYHLKFTFMNPLTRLSEVERLLEQIRRISAA